MFASVLRFAEPLAPLFVLALLGYAVAAAGRWPKTVGDSLATFTFAVALPALLFRLMSDPAQLPPFEPRILLAYFGGCLVTFAIGRLIARRLFRYDGVSQSVFALGGVFSNNVMLGIPLAKAMLGEAAMPSVALVIVFNALILWTLVTASVEWARHGRLSLAGFRATARKVLSTPVVAAVWSGMAVGRLGIRIPPIADRPLELLGQAAMPLALVVVGMGLAEYGVRAGWRPGLGITAVKLLVLPLSVLALGHLLALPPLEVQAIVLLASLSVGVNVYLMARHFGVAQPAVASSMVLSTALCALTTPVALALAQALRA